MIAEIVESRNRGIEFDVRIKLDVRIRIDVDIKDNSMLIFP